MQTFLNAPLLEVAGPTAQPSGFGLYAAAAVIDSSNVREGVRWLDNLSVGAASFHVDCPPTFQLASDGAPLWVEAPAFGVSAGVAVDHPLGLGIAELADLARAGLALQESSAVEAAYWTGKAADGTATAAPALATGATTLTTAAVSLGYGLGLLEEWIGQHTGAQGVVHAPRHLVGSLTSLQVRRDGGKLRTLVDTPVAAGTGYPGTGPDGSRAAGTTWLYATGPVQAIRGPVQDWPADPRMAMDRATDHTAVHATRLVSVGHAVGVAAVQITLT